MQYHPIGTLNEHSILKEVVSRLPLREYAPTTHFPAQDFALKREGRDGQKKMDILPLKASDWFRVEESYDTAVFEKLGLLRSVPELTYCSNNPHSLAGKEALSLAIRYLCERYPERFSLVSSGIQDSVFQREIPIDSHHQDPILTLGGIVEEDLLLLELDPQGEYRISSICACFPSHWSIHQKLGQSLAEVHEGVPNLNKNLASKIDTMMHNLPPEHPVTRMNMLVNFDPRWSQFPVLVKERPYTTPPLEYSTIGEQLYLRNERETIVKLPMTRGVLFTIKTYQTPFSHLPGWACSKLADFHEGFDPDYRDNYRKLSLDEGKMVIEWLRERARVLADNP